MNISLFILKIFSTFLAAALGIIGTISNPRDNTTGRITKYGKLVICVICACAIINFTIDKIQGVQEDQERAHLRNELAQAHKDILRLSNPMDITFAVFSLDVKNDDVSIHDGLTAIKKAIFSIGNRDDLMKQGMMPDSDNSNIYISPDSQFPDIGKKTQQKLEMFSITAFCYTELDISLLNDKKLPKPDLSFHCFFINKNDGNGPHLSFNKNANRFSVEAQIEQEQVHIGANSGKMTSLLDLSGATIVFCIEGKCPLELKNATLYFGKGRSYDIPYFNQMKTEFGYYFLYKFPLDADFSAESKRTYMRVHKVF